MTRTATLSLALLFLLLEPATAQDEATAPAQTQEAPTRDPQALSVLTQALQVAGATTMQTVQSFTAAGTITYHWAGKEVKGTVLIHGKGAEEFSLQASLSKENRTLAVTRGHGAIQEIDGTTTDVQHFNAINQAGATLPLVRILAALGNPSTSAWYEGLADVEGRPAHLIRLVTKDDEVPDPEDRFKALRTLEVFVDASTGLVAKTQDTIHADRDMSDQYSRELFFSDYRLADGVLTPFAIRERFGGQLTWSLQLDSVTFSTI